MATAREALKREDADAELKAAVTDYYAAGDDVSRRLIQGETGEALVDKMVTMQAKQALATSVLKRTVALDRRDLVAAFASAGQSERTARSYELWIGIGSPAGGDRPDTWLSRGVLRSQAELTLGFERFGKGDFGQAISVVSQDELGEIAQRANQMAASLDRHITSREQAEMALKLSNKELEAFSYSVAHDLRAPLRAIHGFSQILMEDSSDQLSAEGKGLLLKVTGETERMGQLIDA